MSIFGDIMSAIFGRSAKAETPAAGSQGPATPTGSPAPRLRHAPATPPAPSAPAAAPAAPVDVAAVLDALAKKNKQKLNWRKSIVDLMKLLDLDSSQTARKKLAEELHYSGDTKDSAKMNVWLHKQVMIKLAANGGKVPADLKDELRISGEGLCRQSLTVGPPHRSLSQEERACPDFGTFSRGSKLVLLSPQEVSRLAGPTRQETREGQ